MPRTVHIRLRHRDFNVLRTCWDQIELQATCIRLGYTWASDRPALVRSPLTRFKSSLLTQPALPPVLAESKTEVGLNDWNAEVLFSFAEWISRLAPMILVEVEDDGDYIMGHRVLLVAGRVIADPVPWCEALLVDGATDERFRPMREHVPGDRSLRQSVPLSEYAHVREVAALELPLVELDRLMLVDAVARVRLPLSVAGWSADL